MKLRPYIAIEIRLLLLLSFIIIIITIIIIKIVYCAKMHPNITRDLDANTQKLRSSIHMKEQ